MSEEPLFDRETLREVAADPEGAAERLVRRYDAMRRRWEAYAGPVIDCAATFPGHERDLGPLIKQLEWELVKVTVRAGSVDPCAAVLTALRHRGVPAVRAYSDDGVTIQVEVAEPRGYG